MRRFFTKKRIIWSVIILLIVGGIGSRIYKSKTDTSNIITEIVKTQDLKQTVLATGQVTSNTDLNLSFKTSGIVRRVNVKVGQKVKAGQLLANLDQKDQLATLTSARGALASAQANYKRVLDGASSEEVAVSQKAVDAAQVTLDNTKKQQELAVENAYRSLLNSTIAAYASTGNINSFTPVVSGSYNGTLQGTYTIRQEGKYFYTLGLETTGNVDYSSGVAVPLGTKGLYVTFPTTYTVAGDSWIVEIPNTKAVTYVTNLNAYNAAINNKEISISSAQAALDSAIAALNLKKAQARPADVQAASAQILSAQGQVQTAQAAVESTEVRAPADGTVTNVEIKVGELATALTSVIVVQDVGNFYLEANISEANVSSIIANQPVVVTFDALGPDREFRATVTEIDPASNVVSGVVNYKVTASIDQLTEIKPGMTANMTIETGSKSNVLAVPQRAVIKTGNVDVVRVVTNSKKKTFVEKPVQLGISADGGLVEIISGLEAGAEIVTFIDQK